MRGGKRFRLLLIEVSAQVDARPGQGTRGAVLPPFPLECLRAYLVRHMPDLVVSIIQIYDLSDSRVMDKVSLFKPDAVGMTVFTHASKRAEQLTGMIKSASPNVKVVWGGYEPSLNPNRVVDSDADFFVLGEGEETALELFRQIAGQANTKFDDIRGIAYAIKGQCEATVTEPRQRILNLDHLPWAARALGYMERAKIYGLMHPEPARQRRVSEIFYSRGCPHSCNFCVSAVQYGTRHNECPSQVTLRSPKNVVAELRELQRQGVNGLYWTDLNCNTDPGIPVFEAMLSEGVHNLGREDDPDHVASSIHSYGLCGVPLDEATAQAMAEAGFTRIGLGVESFNPEEQEWFGKPTPGQANALESLANADKFGIATRCLLVLGSPNDSVEEIARLSNRLHEMDAPIDELRVACMTPYYGTPLYDMVAKSIVDTDTGHWDTDHFVVPTNSASIVELQEARLALLKSYYGDQRYMSRRVKSRLARWPHLRPSYEYFLEFLRQQGLADHRL